MTASNQRAKPGDRGRRFKDPQALRDAVRTSCEEQFRAMAPLGDGFTPDMVRPVISGSTAPATQARALLLELRRVLDKVLAEEAGAREHAEERQAASALLADLAPAARRLRDEIDRRSRQLAPRAKDPLVTATEVLTERESVLRFFAVALEAGTVEREPSARQLAVTSCLAAQSIDVPAEIRTRGVTVAEMLAREERAMRNAAKRCEWWPW